jgi:competence protein ComGC
MQTESSARMRRTDSGQTLVASLIVIAIIAILAVVLFRGTGENNKARPDGRGTTLPGLVKAQAEDEVCKSNLKQVRMAVEMRHTTDDAFPASLEETRLGANYYRCPMGKEPYSYDPSSGQVECPHPGHESY